MSLEGPIQEQDWKYLRSINDEMLHALCSQINEKAVEIAASASGNPHERYRKLYVHIKESDKIVARCFNDWRRSNIDLKIYELRANGLLLDSHVRELSDSARDWLSKVETINEL